MKLLKAWETAVATFIATNFASKIYSYLLLLALKKTRCRRCFPGTHWCFSLRHSRRICELQDVFDPQRGTECQCQWDFWRYMARVAAMHPGTQKGEKMQIQIHQYIYIFMSYMYICNFVLYLKYVLFKKVSCQWSNKITVDSFIYNKHFRHFISIVCASCVYIYTALK